VGLNCPKCKATKIIPKVRIVDRVSYNVAGTLTVQLYENPDAMIFKYSHDGALNAWICGECGYVETSVEKPSELYDAYEQSISKPE
jgi:hypothetical protein